MASARGPAQVALWGADHPDLGSVAVKRIAGEAVVALSAGRHPKPYPHLDPNEDAVLAAVGERCRLLAAADGHNGFDAAAGALDGLGGMLDRLDAAADDPKALLEAFEDAAILGVRHALSRAETTRQRSRTALSLLLSDGRSVHVCQWGDTAAVRVRGGKARLLAPPERFLSPYGEPPHVASTGVRPDDVLLAASDGLTTYLGRDWLRRVAEVVGRSADLEAAARDLMDAAFAGGAGDHVAVALVAAGGAATAT